MVFINGGGQTVPSIPRFGTDVFVQPVTYRYNGTTYVASGQEVPATVISQSEGSGVAWLTLQPLQILEISGANYLVVVSYEAGSSVSYSNV